MAIEDALQLRFLIFTNFECRAEQVICIKWSWIHKFKSKLAVLFLNFCFKYFNVEGPEERIEIFFFEVEQVPSRKELKIFGFWLLEYSLISNLDVSNV